jgi:endogenous inhibitor of DNA gyrase (YacG/DUF329 family)
VRSDIAAEGAAATSTAPLSAKGRQTMKWRCPHCRRELQIASLEALPHPPFCSERCRMADLGGWLSDEFVISQPIAEGDIGETSAADLAPPLVQAPPPDGPVEPHRRPGGEDGDQSLP